MPDARALQSIIDDAEQAASAGDFVAAERLLRDAAVIQEAQFGPLDPGLVRTLNNLAICREKAGHPAEAEAFYRRACTVAVAALPTDDPQRVESQDNLRAFCAARGLALHRSTAATPPVTTLPPASVVPSTPTPVSAASTSSSTPRTAGLIVVGGAVVFVLVRALGLMDARDGVAPQPAPVVDESSTGPATPSVSAATQSQASPPDVAPKPTPSPEPPPPPAAANDTTPRDAPPARPVDAGSPVVVEARLCRDLSRDAGAWACVQATNPTPPGPLSFYTRIAAPVPTRVEHRWYAGDTLFRTVTLAIGASPTEGYRTYSRQTIARDRAGPWRVELRSASGDLLAEERFLVQ